LIGNYEILGINYCQFKNNNYTCSQINHKIGYSFLGIDFGHHHYPDFWVKQAGKYF